MRNVLKVSHTRVMYLFSVMALVLGLFSPLMSMGGQVAAANGDPDSDPGPNGFDRVAKWVVPYWDVSQPAPNTTPKETFPQPLLTHEAFCKELKSNHGNRVLIQEDRYMLWQNDPAYAAYKGNLLQLYNDLMASGWLTHDGTNAADAPLLGLNIWGGSNFRNWNNEWPNRWSIYYITQEQWEAENGPCETPVVKVVNPTVSVAACNDDGTRPAPVVNYGPSDKDVTYELTKPLTETGQFEVTATKVNPNAAWPDEMPISDWGSWKPVEGKLVFTGLVELEPCEVETCETNPEMEGCEVETCETNPEMEGCEVETCETNPEMEGCEVETCETNPEMEGCEVETCETNPEMEGCQTCETNPEMEGCQTCQTNPEMEGCQTCETNPEMEGCKTCETNPEMEGCQTCQTNPEMEGCKTCETNPDMEGCKTCETNPDMEGCKTCETNPDMEGCKTPAPTAPVVNNLPKTGTTGSGTDVSAFFAIALATVAAAATATGMRMRNRA